MKQNKMSTRGKRIAVLAVVMAIGMGAIVAILSLDLNMLIIGGLALAVVCGAAYAIHLEGKEEKRGVIS